MVTPRSYTNHLALADDFKGEHCLCAWKHIAKPVSVVVSLSGPSLRLWSEAVIIATCGARGSRVVPSVFFWLAGSSLRLFIEAPQKGGGAGERAHLREKVVNILLVSRVTFKRCLKMSLGALSEP